MSFRKETVQGRLKNRPQNYRKVASALLWVGICQWFCLPARAQEALPQFSVAGGWQTQSSWLKLSAEDPSFTIWYTLDGSQPVPDSCFRYDSPIPVSGNRVVSARCVSAGGERGPVLTQTYLFLADVLEQPADLGEDYPKGWGYNTADSVYPADYAMDPAICFSKEYASLMDTAFRSIPTLCLGVKPGYLFSHSTDPDTGGIYIHTEKSPGGYGKDWERPASLEYYDPSTGKSFQINCGLRLHGGNSRNPANSAKHSFRVSFRSKYGASKLKFRIFPDSTATKKFDHLVFRAGYNYTWIKNGSQKLYPGNIVQRENAQYIYDSFAKEVQLAMGDPATHRRFVHLFLNGYYWGLYEISEKINNDFAQAYLGGKDEDYDVVGDHNEVIDGTRDVYKKMYAAATAVGSDADDANYALLTDSAWLNLENFVDYMLINWYIGNGDWDENNWRLARSFVNPGKGFCYFVWDAETAFTDVDLDKVSAVKGDPSKMMSSLRKNPEFRLLAADVVQRQLFDGGPLSEEGAAAIYRKLADEIDLAIICESARWGDYRVLTKETEDTYTRNDWWIPRRDDLLADYFPQRTAVLLEQLKDYGLYPQVEAPVFGLPAGVYEADTLTVGLTSTAKKGTVYYTTDGSDPRTPYTSKPSATAGKAGSELQLFRSDNFVGGATDTLTVTARVLADKEWSAKVCRTYIMKARPDGWDGVRIAAIRHTATARGLQYELPVSARVTVEVYSADGRRVLSTRKELQPQGTHETSFEGLPAGFYLYRLTVDGRACTGRFVK